LNRKKIFAIYKTLLKAYGNQGWWPITPKNKFLPEYLGKKNITDREALEVSTGAILTQNTSWNNVVKAIENLNRAGFFKSPFSFSKEKIASLIRPAGYYNQKSGYLKNFLDLILKRYDGKVKKLLSLPPENLRKILLDVKGIGRETADSIILYAAGKPVFVIDAYTKRILGRVFFYKKRGEQKNAPRPQTIFSDYEKARSFMERNLPKDSNIYNEYHALLVRLAKEHCFKKNPDCSSCPLSADYSIMRTAVARRGRDAPPPLPRLCRGAL